MSKTNTFSIVKHFNTRTGVYENKMAIVNTNTYSKQYVEVSMDQLLRIRIQETVATMQAKQSAKK